MSKDYTYPGAGYVTESTELEYCLPGGGLINETTASSITVEVGLIEVGIRVNHAIGFLDYMRKFPVPPEARMQQTQLYKRKFPVIQ